MPPSPGAAGIPASLFSLLASAGVANAVGTGIAAKASGEGEAFGSVLQDQIKNVNKILQGVDLKDPNLNIDALLEFAGLVSQGVDPVAVATTPVVGDGPADSELAALIALATAGPVDTGGANSHASARRTGKELPAADQALPVVPGILLRQVPVETPGPVVDGVTGEPQAVAGDDLVAGAGEAGRLGPAPPLLELPIADALPDTVPDQRPVAPPSAAATLPSTKAAASMDPLPLAAAAPGPAPAAPVPPAAGNGGAAGDIADALTPAGGPPLPRFDNDSRQRRVRSMPGVAVRPLPAPGASAVRADAAPAGADTPAGAAVPVVAGAVRPPRAMRTAPAGGPVADAAGSSRPLRAVAASPADGGTAPAAPAAEPDRQWRRDAGIRATVPAVDVPARPVARQVSASVPEGVAPRSRGEAPAVARIVGAPPAADARAGAALQAGPAGSGVAAAVAVASPAPVAAREPRRAVAIDRAAVAAAVPDRAAAPRPEAAEPPRPARIVEAAAPVAADGVPAAVARAAPDLQPARDAVRAAAGPRGAASPSGSSAPTAHAAREDRVGSVDVAQAEPVQAAAAGETAADPARARFARHAGESRRAGPVPPTAVPGAVVAGVTARAADDVVPAALPAGTQPAPVSDASAGGVREAPALPSGAGSASNASAPSATVLHTMPGPEVAAADPMLPEAALERPDDIRRLADDGVWRAAGLQAEPRTAVRAAAPAVAEAPPPLSTLGAPADCGESLGNHIRWMGGRDLKSAEIQLDPPELGPLQVKIQTHRDGASIQFTTHNAAVRDLVEQSLPRLREMLDGGGSMTLDVQVSQQQGGAAQGGRDQRAAGAGLAGALLASADESIDGGQPARVTQGLVDYYA